MHPVKYLELIISVNNISQVMRYYSTPAAASVDSPKAKNLCSLNSKSMGCS